MLVPKTESAKPSNESIPSAPKRPPAIAVTTPPIGLAKGPTTGSTGGVKANPVLNPYKAAGVIAADSAAERAKVPPAVVVISFFLPVINSLKDELLTRSPEESSVVTGALFFE